MTGQLDGANLTRQPRRAQVWYTSDLHIGHRLIAGLRGFDDSDDHDAELARRWDNDVSAGDTVWVLGDISAGGRGGQRRALEWLSERPGVKHLIAGNHDSVHPMHIDTHKMLSTYLEVFASVQQSARRKLAGQTLLLSHFPYRTAALGPYVETDSRFDQWRLPGMGAWLLHGHSHDSIRRRGKSIHVGLDAWNLAPVSIDTIAQIMQNAQTNDDGEANEAENSRRPRTCG
ncbi:Calcineurin-like phosphoesterase superfamily protein [Mycolicibacterium rutilum]|uniref:Calcineurin-like phosphoesterase superfamily protein n=1 Tax=Mycolicibacterium rutilum TaxID=370526 RepID=A0A1H6J2G7_MYCRU|nr:metallophosphoesterase [Mycolicibacterium rutilum]SEH53665.1 Calcineurin-like phosphoesterase superfamily protein [Mycolicibacterium rutilum]